MWDLRSRAAIALVTALSGCAFLYNISGPILILAVSLFLTVYACYSLIVNDSFVSPHAFLVFRYCKRVTLQLRATFELTPRRVYLYVRQLFQAANRRFRNRYLTQSQSRMERRRASHYQLSSDSYPAKRSSSSFATSNDLNSKSNHCQASGHSLYDQSSFAVKHTSTPLFPRSREELENQRFKLSPMDRSLPRRSPSMYSQTHSTSHGENSLYYLAESSLWNSYTSPKVEEKKAGDKKPVQTVGGPLLTSSRYNIARKVYNDVTSPGLTGRLTKYAEEASNELTRRSQYRVGQFPKVNLHASPVPLINAKSVRARTPVTVRVAPPCVVRYSPPSKQNVFTGSPYSDASCSSPSVAQTLKEMSLKRHASRDDVASDLAKKQRTDGLAGSEFEAQDETKQKRTRDESLKSDEDLSPQSKATRPTKRTKTPSCYDIVNSLGSNKHVVSGIKRKAREYCRSATPDFEKHFKSLECVQSPQTPPRVANSSSGERLKVSEQADDSDACSCANKIDEHSPLKGILKGGEKRAEGELDGKEIGAKRANAQSDERDRSRETGVANEAAKLTHKLFMRAEPERNEKLRMLVEEQGNIRAKFTTDDVEEIKKEDIADMRQTSMKARLQSMFDAISGRTTSGINPDVVIQAEEVTAVQPLECPVTCATLNSSTTTTNVNTTPIFTPAVAPSSASSEPPAKPPKHVAFNLPNKQVAPNASVQLPVAFEKKLETIPTSSTAQTTSAAVSANTFAVSASSVSNANNGTISSTSSSAPTFNFGKSTSSAPVASALPAHPAFNATTTKLTSPLLAASTTTGIFVNAATVAPATPIAPTSAAPTRTNVLQAPKVVSSNSKIEAGNGSAISALSGAKPATPIAATVAEKKEQQSAGTTFIACNANAVLTNSSTVAATAAPSTPVFSFGNKANNPPAATPKYDGFVFATAGNAAQNSGAFGGSSAPRQASTTGNGIGAPANSIANVPATTSLDSNAKTTASTFGLPTSSTFAFCRPAPPLSSSDGKPGFSFGNATPATNATSAMNTTNATNATTASSSASLFAVASNNSVASFGALPSNTGSIFANSVSAPSIFGATATTGSQATFGTSSNLNATTASFVLPKSTSTSVFGATAATTSEGFASATSMPIFSNPSSASSSATPSTASIPVFGASGSAASAITTGAKNTATGNMFAAANLTTSSSTFPATTNIFGQSNSSAGANFRSTSGVFGTNSGSALFNAQPTTSSTFSAANVSSNSTVPAFGSTNVSASTASVSAFGAAATSAPAFGLQSQNKENSGQSSGAQTFGVGTSIFGGENTAVPVFGASSSAVGPFNATAAQNAFSGQNAASSSNSTFGGATGGNANGPAVFGDSSKVSPFGAQPSAFGAPNVTAPAFGASTANNENNNSTGIFTFGANQKPPQQTAGAFSFTGNNNTGSNAAASTSAPFQFGSTTSNSAAGFNFSAPSTTPSINFGTTNAGATFNASTAGMFSIGSGSTAPRSRNIRIRKLR